MSEFVKYSIGAEIEHTPAFSKKTLFVEGLPVAKDVARIAAAERVHHVRFSAKSADHNWDEVITAILDLGFWVTLEFPTQFHVLFQEELSKGVWQSRQFVPLVKVLLHNLTTSGTNLTIKFESDTNDGVWGWNCHELTDHNKFTSWQDYEERVDFEENKPKAARPKVDEEDEPVVKLDPAVVIDTEVAPQTVADDYIKVVAADVPPDVANTTSASIDSADADNEPELVARKTVNEASAKQKAENDAAGKIVKKTK